MASPIQKFFNIVLDGESETYNDHNWYSYDTLRGFIEGKNTTPYSLLKKPLSKYTIQEVIEFQSRPRDNIGQLWATGRYQIIPDTLKGVVTRLNIPKSRVYDQKTQDEMGYSLLMERGSLRRYIQGEVADTKQNLQAAALSVAQIWSSVGVPYDMKGSKQWVKKNQSYYAGGGDVATTDTDAVQAGLKMLRQNKDRLFENATEDGSGTSPQKRRIIFFSLIGLTLIGLSIYAYVKSKK